MIVDRVKKLTDFRFVNLFSARYTDRKSNEKEWIFASRSAGDNPLEQRKSTPDAVVIVPFHEQEQKLLLIKEYRVPLGGFQYGFPAGLVDSGESVEAAGRRELFEETGLTVDRIVRISPRVFSTSGLTDESVSMMFVHCSGEPTSRHNESSEEIEPVWFSKEDAAAVLFDPTLQFDVKTWIVLQAFSGTGQI